MKNWEGKGVSHVCRHHSRWLPRGGEPMNSFESIVRKVGLPIWIVEWSRDSVTEMVVTLEPFQREPSWCEVCQVATKREVLCKGREHVYELTCDETKELKICGDKHIEKTSRSFEERLQREEEEKCILETLQRRPQLGRKTK